MMKKIYFSMPITGFDVDERIKHAEEAKSFYSNEETEVITPFDASPYDPNETYGGCMKNCITELIKCDAVIFDTGWYNSNGCRIEAEVARGCGIEMIFV